MEIELPSDGDRRWLTWRGYLTPAQCTACIAHARTIEPQPGRIGLHDKHEDVDQRSSLVRFINNAADEWVRHSRRFCAMAANVLDIEVSGRLTSIQISQYPPGGFYKWHQDTYVAERRAGVQEERKVSVVIALTHQWLLMQNVDMFELRPGDAIAFPSLWQHMVPENAGERWSLAAWMMGPPWR